MSNTKEELIATCRRIRDELTRFTDSTLVYNAEEGCFQPNDGNTEDAGMRGYFDDCDIRLITDLGGNLLGARICVGYGGPNLYIDTYKEIVEGFWGLDHVEVTIPFNVCKMIDEEVEEMRY